MKRINLTQNRPFSSKQCFIFMTLAIVTFLPSISFGKLRNYETTRMKSTAGAGVGSILLDEATLLNPASMGLYTVSSMYFQRGESNVTPTAVNTAYKGVTPENFAVIASDAGSGTGGSLSYTNQKFEFDSRKRFSISLASPVSQSSSIGVTYRHSTDLVSNTGDGLNITEDDYSQIVFGMIHALNPSFSIGLIAIDPFKVKTQETRGILGFQYVYKAISLMLDLGSNYYQDLSYSAIYKGAVQVQVLNDFYLRFGAFKDKGIGESGNGIGGGWVGPKLVIDLALKNTNVDSHSLISDNGQQIKESSFSLSYRF
jgi:hypothetical protein